MYSLLVRPQDGVRNAVVADREHTDDDGMSGSGNAACNRMQAIVAGAEVGTVDSYGQNS